MKTAQKTDYLLFIVEEMKKYNLQFDAKITLMLREQDVALLLNSIKAYNPLNKDEEENRKYLLGLLDYLSLP
jgi:hypothetical protein